MSAKRLTSDQLRDASWTQGSGVRTSIIKSTLHIHESRNEEGVGKHVDKFMPSGRENLKVQ